MTAHVRLAQPQDAALIYQFIRELADYEHLLDHVVATPELISEALFGAAPKAFCDIVDWQDAQGSLRPAGFALWFYNFSTFQGRHGIFLEDLYVQPEFRGHGLGKVLLKNLAARCVTEGLGRLQWNVLDWNAPSIAFYQAQGAKMMEDWTAKKHLPQQPAGDEREHASNEKPRIICNHNASVALNITPALRQNCKRDVTASELIATVYMANIQIKPAIRCGKVPFLKRRTAAPKTKANMAVAR
eukprot:gene7352-7420_t